jgi:hypothetical protein
MKHHHKVPLTILLINKTGKIQTHHVAKFKEENVYKFCKFKVSDGFGRIYEDPHKKSTWTVTLRGYIYFLDLYAKTDGKYKNKYSFPFPVKRETIFHTCAIVAKRSLIHAVLVPTRDTSEYYSLTLPLWKRLLKEIQKKKDRNEKNETSKGSQGSCSCFKEKSRRN